MQNSKSRIQKLLRAFCIFNLAFLVVGSGGCSIPNLETTECSGARDAAKRFYSFHFANDMAPSKENLSARQQYLTPRLFNSLWAADTIAGDHFTSTFTSDHPKAFRVGTCTAESPEKINMQVILFWKDDSKSEQKEISVEMLKQDDKWLVDGVSPAKAK